MARPGIPVVGLGRPVLQLAVEIRRRGDVRARHKPPPKSLFILAVMPLDAETRGGSSSISNPKEPADAATGSVGQRLPMPDSLSCSSLDGTACACFNGAHVPPIRSSVVREGSIRAWMKPANAEVITNTRGVSFRPSPPASVSCVNQRSHWTWNPSSWTRRSAGSEAYSGRIRRRLSP
jgi:hypothetical protein